MTNDPANAASYIFPWDDRDRLVELAAQAETGAATLPGLSVEELLLRALGDDRRLTLDAAAHLAGAGWTQSPAQRHLRWAPIGRARIESALVGVPVELLERLPGLTWSSVSAGTSASPDFPVSDKWTVRQQLMHVELTYVRYALATTYALRRSDSEPLSPPPDMYPARAGDPAGTLGEPVASVIVHLRTTWADAIRPLLGVTEAELQRPTEWHTAEHTVGFRLHRFGAHDLELATDVRNTLASLGFVQTRAQRLAALLIESWAEVESILLGLSNAIARSPAADGRTLDALIVDHRENDRQVVAQLERVRSAGAAGQRRS